MVDELDVMRSKVAAARREYKDFESEEERWLESFQTARIELCKVFHLST